jgi:hypothetical protein
MWLHCGDVINGRKGNDTTTCIRTAVRRQNSLQRRVQSRNCFLGTSLCLGVTFHWRTRGRCQHNLTYQRHPNWTSRMISYYLDTKQHSILLQHSWGGYFEALPLLSSELKLTRISYSSQAHSLSSCTHETDFKYVLYLTTSPHGPESLTGCPLLFKKFPAF